MARPAGAQYRPVRAGLPPLVGEARSALSARTPLDIMEMASGIVEAATVRPADRFSGSSAPTTNLGELLDSFVGSEFPAMVGLARAVLPLVQDDLVVKRTRRHLDALPPGAARGPAWLDDLDAIVLEEPYEMVHVLGDGDNVLVGWRWPHGGAATAIVYIDHNLGTVVKDAFVLPITIERTMEQFRRIGDDPDQALRPLPAADARARIVDAIAHGEITMPPFVSDTWPLCRPLVEWVVSKLPEGGTGYERPDWPESAREELIARFVASPFAAELPLTPVQVRELVDPLVWFGCDYGPGDPLRWSPVSVEIVLGDWYERKVLGDRRLMRELPSVLAAFVRFAHTERAIRPSLTTETLQAVERWTPDYLESLQGPERSPFQGAMDLARRAAGFARGIELDDDVADDDRDDDDIDDDDLGAGWSGGGLDIEALLAEFHQRLEADMGGPEAIATLDRAPLPDEPFDWSVVPPALEAAVAAALGAIDRVCDDELDVEMRTISRRLLARMVVEDPGAFRRSPHHDRLAAGVVAVACQDNGVLRGRNLRWAPYELTFAIGTQKALAAAMGVPATTVGERARTVRNALGLEEGRFDAALAHSAKRRWYLEQYERTADWPAGVGLDDEHDRA